jgi:hypothetical protein
MNIIKNLSYPRFEEVKNKNAYIPESGIKNELDLVNYLILYTQYKEGIRLFVEKEVILMLDKVDIIDINFEDIKFPSSSIELFFDAHDLPTTIISNKKNVLDNIKNFKQELRINMNVTSLCDGFLTYKDDNGIFFMTGAKTETNKPSFFGSLIPEGAVNNFINDKAGSYIDRNSDKFTTDRTIYKTLEKKIFTLAMKIFLYISIPEYRAIPITEKQLHRQGKAGVNNRPKRPLSKVIYVPSIININKNNILHKNTVGKVIPHFRRGHFMMLRHERYKEQGKLIFRKPSMVHGGSIQDKLYVARKYNDN